LEYVTQSFDRCVADLNAKAEKLDDRMEPLPSDICGSVRKLSDETKSV